MGNLILKELELDLMDKYTHTQPKLHFSHRHSETLDFLENFGINEFTLEINV